MLVMAARTSESVSLPLPSWSSMRNASSACSGGRKASRSSRSMWFLHVGTQVWAPPSSGECLKSVLC